jgi:hypothetical protein
VLVPDVLLAKEVKKVGKGKLEWGAAFLVGLFSASVTAVFFLAIKCCICFFADWTFLFQILTHL